jgi:glycolate oxidase FAD binding subunit
MTDAIIADWQERIRAAAASKSALRIRGGGSKDFYGQTLAGDVLETGAYTGIIDYDATELVITARAGTPLTEIDAAMRERGQMLAFEPPHFGADGVASSSATLGGCVAAGLSGPRRPHAGAVRDLILGVRILDGNGEDLSLAVESCKMWPLRCIPADGGLARHAWPAARYFAQVRPRTQDRTTRVFAYNARDATLATGAPLVATGAVAGHFHPRIAASCADALSGAEAVVVAVPGYGHRHVLDAAQSNAFWRSVRDHTHRYFAASTSAGASLWRLAVKSTEPYMDLGGEQLIEWSGGLRWLLATDRTDPARVRSWAVHRGGHATLFRATDKTPGVFHPLSDTILALHRRLKAQFDPANILNPGRCTLSFKRCKPN